MVSRTPQEKMFIVHMHKYFMAEAQQRLDPLGRAVRERVVKSLALSESMVARVLGAYNVHGKEAFAVPPATASKIICSELKTLKGEAIPCERSSCEWMFPTSEVQDLAGEATDKVHCSTIMGEMDTSARVRDGLIRIQC
ncbi:hypothetical protein JG688_00016464 [Phytophthora aleatoria]|uniref:Uncharacterized protein n=1 Tax=Phytophthora aleatoria TaxID=2496075 RepID=A0A8J5IIW2_9STRA|nr:hypothetical protein JG688_00016464 [Phytophthora aleatoria]